MFLKEQKKKKLNTRLLLKTNDTFHFISLTFFFYVCDYKNKTVLFFFFFFPFRVSFLFRPLNERVCVSQY